jgi:hypothetical protein
LCFLPQVDQIVMIENGTIMETGSFEDLKNKDGAFAKFIKLYLQNNEANKETMSINFMRKKKSYLNSLIIL